MRRFASSCLALAALASAAPAAELTTLRSFNFSVGRNPAGGLHRAADGSLYGTTNPSFTAGSVDLGAVYRYVPATNALARVAPFSADLRLDGYAPLARDATGDLYGAGGSGVVKFSPATGALTAVAVGGAGFAPRGKLTFDAAGNLYGGEYSPGRVFKLAAGTGAISTVAELGIDAAVYGGPVLDAAGNLYGTTADAPSSTSGFGTVFRVAAGTNVATTLHAFDDAGGRDPDGALLLAPDGFLYGTTVRGGPSDDGVIYRLDPSSGAFDVLAAFDRATTGTEPAPAGLVRDAAGNLFGVARFGGAFDAGTVFKLDAATGQLAALASFEPPNGRGPSTLLGVDAATGDFLGATEFGGSSNFGTIYKVTDTGFVVPEPGAVGVLAGGVILLARRRAREGGATPDPAGPGRVGRDGLGVRTRTRRVRRGAPARIALRPARARGRVLDAS